MRDHSFTIGVGQKDDRFFGESNYLRVQSSAVVIRVETDDGRTLTLSQGDAVTVKQPFKKLFFSHASGLPQPVTIIVGNDIEVSSSTFSGNVSGSVSHAQGATIVNTSKSPGTISMVLVAASAIRRAIYFQNAGGFAVVINASPAAQSEIGIILQPGDIWIEDVGAGAAWDGKLAGVELAGVSASLILITEVFA